MFRHCERKKKDILDKMPLSQMSDMDYNYSGYIPKFPLTNKEEKQ